MHCETLLHYHNQHGNDRAPTIRLEITPLANMMSTIRLGMGHFRWARDERSDSGFYRERVFQLNTCIEAITMFLDSQA